MSVDRASDDREPTVEGLLHWRPESTGAAAAGEGPWRRLDWCDPHEGRLLAADSWRVVDGHVRALDRHRERFLEAVSRHRTDGERFFDAVLAALPRTGDHFPRVELRARDDGTTLALRLRPTPARTETVVLATAPYDPRTEPLVKGPDLDALQRLRTAVQPLGAGEAVILSPEGAVVEGAYSALLWWRADGVLAYPSDAHPRIPSVTEGLVLEAARAAGVAIEPVDARPADLAGCELWALSALHGLRVVTEWAAGPALAIEPGRAERGRGWLEAALATPVPLTGYTRTGG